MSSGAGHALPVPDRIGRFVAAATTVSDIPGRFMPGLCDVVRHEPSLNGSTGVVSPAGAVSHPQHRRVYAQVRGTDQAESAAAARSPMELICTRLVNSSAAAIERRSRHGCNPQFAVSFQSRRGVMHRTGARIPAFVALILAMLALGACTTTRETSPQRSASEQLLISTAVDRAIAQVNLKNSRRHQGLCRCRTAGRDRRQICRRRDEGPPAAQRGKSRG